MTPALPSPTPGPVSYNSFNNITLSLPSSRCSTIASMWYHFFPERCTVSEKFSPSLGAVSLDTLLQMFVSQERVSMSGILCLKVKPSVLRLKVELWNKTHLENFQNVFVFMSRYFISSRTSRITKMYLHSELALVEVNLTKDMTTLNFQFYWIWTGQLT